MVVVSSLPISSVGSSTIGARYHAPTPPLYDCDPATMALLHHPSMGVVVMDHRGTYLQVNPIASRFLGEASEHLVGKTHLDLFPDTPLEELFAEASERTWVCFSLHRPASSSCEPARSWDISIARRDGADDGYLMLIQEVSSFRNALQEVTWHHALLENLVERVPAGVIVARSERGEIAIVNAAAIAFFQDVLRPGAALTDAGSPLVPLDEQGCSLPIEAHPLISTLRNGNSFEGVTISHRGPDGQQLTLLMDCAPLGFWDGEPVAIAVFQDITEHIRHERELEQQNRQLLALEHAKDTFLANVSHELKTPLTIILGWASAAREMGDPALAAQALEVIERNAQRQAWLVEDLLTLTNCLAGRLQLQPAKVFPLDICEEAVVRARAALHDPQITIELDVPSSLSFCADPLRLRQLLENLLTNAMKFTPPGGTVTLSGHEEGDSIILDVDDTGIGLNTTQLPSIFSPFWQADTSTSRKFGGAGIGLTVVKELVALHGGEVSVSSAGPDQGARFRVRLPKDGGGNDVRSITRM